MSTIIAHAIKNIYGFKMSKIELRNNKLLLSFKGMLGLLVNKSYYASKISLEKHFTNKSKLEILTNLNSKLHNLLHLCDFVPNQ